VVGIYADEMGVGPSGSNNKKRFSRNLQVLVQEEEVTWLEEKAKAIMQRVEAVSLTADMWTSINMDAYLAVTCHYVDDSVKLATVLLGVLPFPELQTAVNISAAMRSLMEEWGIEGKVTSIVTDAGAFISQAFDSAYHLIQIRAYYAQKVTNCQTICEIYSKNLNKTIIATFYLLRI